MRPITFWDRLRYEFDNFMTRGTAALLVLLFLMSVVFIVGIAVLIWISGIDVREDGSHVTFGMLMWMVLLRTLDPGTMGGDTGTDEFLAAMLIVTFGGIFLISTLIGIISNGIQARIEELRKGRSFVVEQGHVLILGWSFGIYEIVRELVIANMNQRRACIVILAERDKIEMEEDLRAHVGDTKTTRLVCRTGNPIEPTDLEIVNPLAARAIVIVSPETADPDSEVIKTLLALVNESRAVKPQHIVAEIRDPKTMALARLVGKEHARFVLVSELVTHILVQTCRHAGLSEVCGELLGFEGDEIYFHVEPALVGKSFGDALLRYHDSALMGLYTADKRVQLNPPMDTLIKDGDQIVALSKDDDTIRLVERAPEIDHAGIVNNVPRSPAAENILLLGWNHQAVNVINELDTYVQPDSLMTVVADTPNLEKQVAARCAQVKHLKLFTQESDYTDRRVLDDLNLALYDHVVVLGDAEARAPQHADARTLITLLHLRDLRENYNLNFSVVSEMRDARNRDLAQATRADDFIISHQLASAMLAQIVENREMTAVFAELFSPHGAELYLRPARDYVNLNRSVNFYTVVQAARERGEIALGYRLHPSKSAARAENEIHLNPPKSNLLTFGEADRIIVLAND